jgi:DNA-binding CsgD family transcriptional regulator
MRTWLLDSRAPHGWSDLDRSAALIAALGVREDRAFARAVLGLFDDLPAIAQCTVFVYEAGRPRTLSVADYRGGPYLRAVADAYAQRFHALDGIQPIIAAAAGTLPVLHQQSSAEIRHATYRHVCYRRPSVSERLALLAPQPGRVWLSVNLYRHDQAGSGFQSGEIARVQAAAPLVMHAVARHWALCGQQRVADHAPLAERLTHLCPELSPRERDVLCGILSGRTTPEIAAQLGVQPSSVISYQKRAYRRLGISGQRQLFPLVGAYQDHT